MKILITGGSGKLGTALRQVFKEALLPTRKVLDITDSNQAARYIKNIKPDVVIHTAALADIRKCETDKKAAWTTNVEGTKNLVNASRDLASPPYFIFISTACVFAGDSGFYKETDIPSPKNFYSLTKLVGETVVANSGLNRWLVIRTNFVANSPWPYPKAFTDRFGTYLFTSNVAQGVKELIKAEMTGIVHLTGNTRLSMYDLAKKVSPKVKPTTLNDYKGPPLTKDMSLDSTRWKRYKLGFT